MLRLRKVAVTGGIGSGKSTVTGFFQKLGAYVISADQIVHKFLSSNTKLREQVIALLGKGILVAGSIDRKKMADLVFSRPELLHELETLIHPLVAQEIAAAYEEAARTGQYPLFIAEVPLLFEAKQQPFYDTVLCVLCPELQAKERSKLSDVEYERRASQQLSPKQKAARANCIIENTGSVKMLEAVVASVFKLLSKGEYLDDESRK